jgi:hypothetical protein
MWARLLGLLRVRAPARLLLELPPVLRPARMRLLQVLARLLSRQLPWPHW